MAELKVIEGVEPQTFELEEGETIVGRRPGSGLHLKANAVSGTHAKITLSEQDGVFIEDLGSRNGTYINDQPLSGREKLQHNDRIHFGPVLLQFVMQEQAFPNPDSPQGIESDSSLSEATITGSISSSSRYGLFDVNPETKLKAVLEISTSLAGAVEMASLLPRIVKTLLRIFPTADRACILLKDQETGEMKIRAARHRREGSDATIKPSQTVLKKVVEEGLGILSADASQEFSASQSIADLAIRSMMCVPMMSLDGEPIGVINIDSQSNLGRFGDDDLDLLVAVAGQAAIAYENTRLMSSFLAKQKQDNELAIARDIQRALLPFDLPSRDGWSFFASYDSAQAVGGDYYDAFVLDEKKICFAFGDVAGKGVPGALIMSRISSCVQSTMKFCHDPVDAALAINEHMCDSAVEGRFVTFVLIVIDFSTNEMSVVNAGHMSPIIRHIDGTLDEFDDDKVGPPIGIVEEYPYEMDKRVIQPGETVVVFTDGVDEAMDPEGELYGMERIRQFVKDASPQADALGRDLLADVRKHAAGRAQNDDITIMTIGRSI